MKHIQIFTLAATILFCSTGSAIEKQSEFTGPDIKEKLDRIIEIKMDALIHKPSIDQRKLRVKEQWEINRSI